MAKKLKYALIGCGGCGVGKHLTSYAMYPDDIELYGVYDYEPAKAKAAAEKFCVPHIFADYKELLADPKIDVVSVVTPNAQHAPITIAALKAGKHVHVEKPVSLNAAEAQAIVDTKNATGKKVMVALNNRFTESSLYAKKYVDEGHLGEIYHARCGWRRRRGFAMHGSWFANKELSGGGPVIDLGVHFFDLTLFLMGFPAPAVVSASTYDKIANPAKKDKAAAVALFGGNDLSKKFTVEDFAAGFVKLETGASVAFEFSWASNIEQETTYFELLGTQGGMSMYNGKLKIFTNAAGVLADLMPQVQNTTGWGENETKHFIECIRKDKAPLSPPEDAVKMMKIIDAIYASSQAGREVVLDTVTA